MSGDFVALDYSLLLFSYFQMHNSMILNVLNTMNSAQIDTTMFRESTQISFLLLPIGNVYS